MAPIQPACPFLYYRDQARVSITIELLLARRRLAGQCGGKRIVADRGHQSAQRVHARDGLHINTIVRDSGNFEN